jgi:hypothetical protein
MPGPGTNSASDSDVADFIDSNCRVLTLRYEFGFQGQYQFLASFNIAVGMVTSEDHPGQPWTGQAPSPYPTPSQVVYIHNDNQVITAASCSS